MAEYDQSAIKVEEGSTPTTVEATDRGLFDFGGKKQEDHVKKPQEAEAVIWTEFDEKVRVSEPEHKHGGLLEKLHRSDSSSSSSSEEEEVEEGGEKKKKKKKEVKDKIKEKISGDKKEEEKNADYEDTSIPVEKFDEPAAAHAHAEAEEKKGFLEKIKEKLPGGQKKTEEAAAPAPPPPAAEYTTTTEGEAKEKKGFLEKIKEKLPGYHCKPEDEKEKEKEKEAASHY